MVLDLAEMDFNLKVKWWVRPRQLDGSTVEDYYTQFCNWRDEMVRLSIPAEEEDYVEQFIINLRWDIRYRLYRYESWSRVIDVYHDAKFEESMMIIEENLRQIKEVFDELSHSENGENGELHGAEVVGDDNGDEILVQIEEDSENDVSPNAEDNRSTGLEFLVMNTHPDDAIEDVAARECEQNVQNIDALISTTPITGILTDNSYTARFEEETNDMEVVFGENVLERGACNVFDETFKSIPPGLQSSFEICSSVGVYSTHSMSRYVWEDASIPLKTEKLLINGMGKYHTSHNRGLGVVFQLFDKMPQVTFVWSFEDIVGAKCYVPLIDWVPMVFDPGDGIETPSQNHAIFCNDGAAVTTAEEMAEHEAFISAIRMAGISAASTYTIRFEGATYVITRATSEKNVMVYDAFDGMTQSKQMDVTRVHRGMISSHKNHSSFMVGNEWCSTDLNSHSKNNLVYTNLWKCENVYSLNDILLLVFDPGGCSLLCKDCRLLEHNEEHEDFHFTTNAVDASKMFYYAFDGDSARQFSKGIPIIGLSMAIQFQSMALAGVVFEEQFCEQKQAIVLLRKSQQALFRNWENCNVVVSGLPMQRVPFDFAERSLLPLAYTMQIRYILLGSNISAYQNAGIHGVTHNNFHLLDGFKHSQTFCVVELLLVGLNKDGLHSLIHALGAKTTVHQHVKVQIQRLRDITGAPVVFIIVHFSGQNWVTEFLSNGNDQSAEKVLEDFGTIRMIIGLDMSWRKELNWIFLLCGLNWFHYMRSIGMIVIKWQIFVWDPGQNIIFIYILEDKDVVERVGKEIVLMNTTLVISVYEHEVQMRCLDTMKLISDRRFHEHMVVYGNSKDVMNDILLQVEE